MKHQILKVTKEEKQLGETMFNDCMSYKVLDITTPFQHKVAEQLVINGMAEVTKKKNYGRIAQIKGLGL